MNQAAYCLFETLVGPCGIAWRETGDARHPHAVLRFQLPEASPQLTEKCIARSSSSLPVISPPPQIAELIARIQQHLAGNPQDFQNVPLDLAGVADFARQVYEAALKIPPGQTTTYGELARVVGRPAESRAVGQAMAKNPIPLIIPC